MAKLALTHSLTKQYPNDRHANTNGYRNLSQSEQRSKIIAHYSLTVNSMSQPHEFQETLDAKSSNILSSDSQTGSAMLDSQTD